MNTIHIQNLQATALSLYETSSGIFWSALPVMIIFACLMIYMSGEITGAKFEAVFRKIIIAILLLIAFPEISSAIQGIESSLITAFGGDTGLIEIFAKVGDHAKEIKESSSGSWFKIGQFGLSIISTLSFLLLAVVRRFLDVLHLTLWNLIHILGPLGLLGCLFPAFSNIPKGIFLGMFELSLWKPIWVILARLLLAIGFGETPADASHWFDTAVMNFAVAGLMACTPMLVHGFLSGTLASVGGSVIQTMLSGAGVALTRIPMKAIQSGTEVVKRNIQRPVSGVAKYIRARKSAQPNKNKK